MKSYWIFLAVTIVVIVAGYAYLSGKKLKGGGPMTVSSVFKNGGDIPREFTCDGANVSPQLVINDIPTGAKSIAIIVDDPDAPIGVFTHWIAWNLKFEGNTLSVPKAMPRKASMISQGMNDFGRIGYDGPCPPRGHGKHHYHFKVFAVDREIPLRDGANRRELEKYLKGHVLAEAETVGLYGR